MNATWFRDDVPVPDCEDFRYVSDGGGAFGLSVADPFSADSGVYSCKVINKFGEAVSTGELVVRGSCSNNVYEYYYYYYSCTERLFYRARQKFPANFISAIVSFPVHY